MLLESRSANTSMPVVLGIPISISRVEGSDELLVQLQCVLIASLPMQDAIKPQRIVLPNIVPNFARVVFERIKLKKRSFCVRDDFGLSRSGVA